VRVRASRSTAAASGEAPRHHSYCAENSADQRAPCNPAPQRGLVSAPHTCTSAARAYCRQQAGSAARAGSEAKASNKSEFDAAHDNFPATLRPPGDFPAVNLPSAAVSRRPLARIARL